MEQVNDYLNYYHSDENPEDSKFTFWKRFQRKFSRFLWWCAGADINILLKCPMQDRVKYAGIGGLVFCTGLLAGLSGAFAFYTVFGPRGNAIESEEVSTLFVIGCALGGLVWGLIVLNMDRFIISSTGKGIDGADDSKITGTELVQGIPRILIAFILGLVISAPLEIRIQKDAIDRHLQIKQNKYLDELNAATDKSINQQLSVKKEDLAKIEKEITDISADFEKRRLEIEVANQKLIDEIAGRSRSGTRGYGNAAKQEEARLKRMQEALDGDMASKMPELENLRGRRKDLQAQQAKFDEKRDNEYAHNIELKNQMDGLVERLEISHEMGLIWLFILLMFLAIEMGPIFFKMMVSKGVYEFMLDNQKKRMLAKNGIIEEQEQIDHPDGTKIAAKYSYLEMDLEHELKKIELEKQKDLSNDVIENWHSKKKKDIEENPGEHYTEK